jgi:hypothetical protein
MRARGGRAAPVALPRGVVGAWRELQAELAATIFHTEPCERRSARQGPGRVRTDASAKDLTPAGTPRSAPACSEPATAAGEVDWREPVP